MGSGSCRHYRVFRPLPIQPISYFSFAFARRVRLRLTLCRRGAAGQNRDVGRIDGVTKPGSGSNVVFLVGGAVADLILRTICLKWKGGRDERRPREVRMDWFGWRLSKDPAADKAAVFGPQAMLQDLNKRVPKYIDDVDQGKLVFPACKRMPSDAHGDLGSIWDHTRLEAIRYVTMVPRREFELLAESARQPEMLDAYLRQLPHEDTVIEFTGSTMSDLAIAIVAGFNWLTHCAVLAGVDRDKFSGTLSNFRKIVVLAQQWWAIEGADERCSQMLVEREKPPLLLYLIWTEYTRLAKEIASTAFFGSFLDRAIDRRREVLNREFSGRPAKLNSALVELTETMASFERARDPDDLTS